MIDHKRLANAYHVAKDNLLQERNEQGHWTGQLSTSALSTATAISALSAVQKATRKKDHQDEIHGGVQWLSENQNPDGGWGDTRKSYSNISTTLLAIAAFHFSGRQNDLKSQVARAEKYVQEQGGIPSLRKRYGKDKTFAVPILANCAMAGTQGWNEVAAFPFEAACVPQRFYHWMQFPVVSYAIPALVAIGQAKYFHDPPWNPLLRILRRCAVGRSLRILERMQPASGGFLEAVPLTSFVVMGLATTGRAEHPVVKKGIEFIQHSMLSDGSWPIDSNLATWNTTLSVNSLSTKLNCNKETGTPLKELGCTDWILNCQNKSVHPFTHSPPGGWGWTDLSGAVPDADDTPGALLALSNLKKYGSCSGEQKLRIRKAATLGVNWLLKLQNRDKGWPTFCRGWGKFPFDRSGADITAHCLRGINCWRNEIDTSHHKVDRAIASGLQYLEKAQEDNGSWLPLWFGNQDHPEEENPVYGTSKVLAAFSDLSLIKNSTAQRGLKWLANSQNQDGSWGGGPSCSNPFSELGMDGPDLENGQKIGEIGSVEETALALEALLLSEDLHQVQNEVNKGIIWLIKAVETDCYRIAWPIGFYFAKLWYHERLYPQIFTVSALGRAMARLGFNLN